MQGIHLTIVLAPLVALLLVVLYRRLRAFPRAHAFLLEWVLGKRTWLGIGVCMHLGIFLLMNVGTFVHVMVASYFAWLSGDDVDAMWRVILWRPARPGFGGRPERPRGPFARLWFDLALPLHRLRFRVRPQPIVALHDGSEARVRRLALLRCWDVAERVTFERAEGELPADLCVRLPDGALARGERAGRALVRVFPGLWPLWLVYPFTGRIALRVLHQRG